MNGEYRQSIDELQQHLQDTIQALELSIDALDKGYEGEAKRLAASIRVLVYDTGSSKSVIPLLSQRNKTPSPKNLARNGRSVYNNFFFL